MLPIPGSVVTKYIYKKKNGILSPMLWNTLESVSITSLSPKSRKSEDTLLKEFNGSACVDLSALVLCVGQRTRGQLQQHPGTFLSLLTEWLSS